MPTIINRAGLYKCSGVSLLVVCEKFMPVCMCEGLNVRLLLTDLNWTLKDLTGQPGFSLVHYMLVIICTQRFVSCHTTFFLSFLTLTSHSLHIFKYGNV